MKDGRAGLFLTELIFDLLIFALCAAVCVSLFARAHGMQAQSRRLCATVAIAQTAAEQLRAGESPAETGWGEDGSYGVAVRRADSGGLSCWSVAVWNAETGRDAPIYTLDCAAEVSGR